MKNKWKLFWILGLGVVISLSLSSCQKESFSVDLNSADKGCGDFLLYKNVSIEGFEFSYIWLSIRLDEEWFDNQYHELPMDSGGLRCNLDSYNKENTQFCSDIADPDLELIFGRELQTGSIRFRLSDRDDNGLYQVDLEINNPIFIDSDNEEWIVDDVKFEDVVVGWYAG